MRRFALFLPLSLLLPTAGCRPTACWSPDSKQLVLDARGLLLTYNVETRRFKQITQGPDQALAPAWSREGKLIHYRASFKNNRIIAMDVAVTDPATGATTSIVPDIKPPLDARQEGPTLNILAGADKNALELMREILDLAPSPDGSRLLYSTFDADKTALWVAAPDGSNPRRLTPPGANFFHAAWSPSGDRVAYYRADDAPEQEPGKAPGPARGSGVLEVMNADGSGARRLFQPPKGAGAIATLGPLPQWTPDGKSLRVFVDMEQKPGDLFPERCDLWQVPVTGGAATRLTAVPAPSPFLSIGAGGAGFFFTPKNPQEQDPMLGFIGPDFKTPRQLGRITSQMLGTVTGAEVETIPVPAISPDGSRIAIAFLPKGFKPQLLLQGTAPGSKLEKIEIPLPIVGVRPPSPKPAPRKPPVKKPAAKKPTPKR